MILLLLFGATAASADDHGHFFLYVAPSMAASDGRFILPVQHQGNAALVHVGGGGEGALTHTFGIGTDVGGVFPSGRSGKIGIISVNVFYHPVGQHHEHIDPFVAGGYAWFLGANRNIGVPNAGGGLNYWFTEHHRYHWGVKLEFREYVRGGEESLHYSEARLGVALWQ